MSGQASTSEPEPPLDRSADIERVLDRLDTLVDQVDVLPGTAGDVARALAETLYLVHRSAVSHLADELGDEVQTLRQTHPAIAWLFDVYLADLEKVTDGAATGDRAFDPPRGAKVLPVVTNRSPSR